MKVLLLTLLAHFTALAAAGHGEAHGNEIPTVIFWQVLNLAILFAILYKYLKQPTIDYFKNRQSDFLQQAEKYKALFAEAEKEYLDIQHRLELLGSTSDASIEKAHKEAAELKLQMLAEAREVAQRLKREALESAKLESQRAYQKIHNQMARDAVALARNVMSKDIGAQDHQKLQSEFNKNLEAVNP